MNEVELENIIRTEIDFDEMSDAAEELALNHYSKFLEIAVGYLKNDKSDMYFQTLLLDYTKDIDKSKIMKVVLNRNYSLQSYLLGSIMENMIYLSDLEDIKEISKSVKNLYLKLDESDKKSIKEVYSEFNLCNKHKDVSEKVMKTAEEQNQQIQ